MKHDSKGAQAHVKGPSAKSTGATELLYLADTYCLRCTSSVTAVESPAEGLACVTLAATVMYPQGGGQPTDIGVIKNKAGVMFEVSNVAVDKGTGVVRHEGKFFGGTFAEGEEVEVEVDEGTRRLNARNHSAGHLLDAAMENIGFNLVPTKGYHFAKGAYVEYEGNIDAKDRPAVIEKLEKECNRLISAGGKVKRETVARKDVAAKCGGYDPPYIPQDQNDVRIISVSGHGSPCGGTHVVDISEIKGLTITKLKAVKTNGVKGVRVGYAIAA